MALLLKKVAVVSLALLLSACSTDQTSKREVSGGDNYLKTPEPSKLIIPTGMVLPLAYSDYQIPETNTVGVVGNAVDVRPPPQVIQLLSGAQVQVTGNTATLSIENAAKNQNIWPQLKTVLNSNNYPVLSEQAQSIATDWIIWSRLDEATPYRARYDISLKQVSYQQVLTIHLSELRQGNNDVAITEPNELNRYTVMMVNSLIDGLYQQQNAYQIATDKNDKAELSVQTATDDTGLPMLVVRGTYGVVWNRLPSALESVGMSISDRNRSQGTMTLKYKGLSSQGYEALGITDPQLKNSEYLLQVGDLDNRTSLQFRDSKGVPVSEANNLALLEVMQAAFKHSKVTQ